MLGSPYRHRLSSTARLAIPFFVALTVVWLGSVIIPAHTQASPVVTVQSSATAVSGDPQSGNPVAVPGSDIATVTLTLTGGQCPTVRRTIPVDVVLVFDTSNSMTDPTSDAQPISKLDATKQAALDFVKEFNLINTQNPTQARNSDQIAVVSFSTEAQTVLPLSRDRNAIQTAIQGLAVNGGTDIAAGLRAATDLLIGSGTNFAGNSSPVIVLLSDGGSDYDQMLAEANRARQLANARIVTIGLGTPGTASGNVGSTGVERDKLAGIANGGSRDNPDNPNDDAYFSETSDGLRQIYSQIATSIQPVIAAKNLAITYTVDTSHFRLAKDSIQPPPFSTSDQQIVWNVGELLRSNTKQLTFQVEALGAGSFNVGSGNVVYLSCTETSQTDTLPFQGPMLTVLMPTSTPTPTATLTPTATPTFTPTPTATPNSIMRTPVPGSVVPVSAPTSTLNACLPGVWDWLPWIAALLAAIVMYLILLRPFLTNRDNQPDAWKSWCFWVRVMLAAWITFLVWLFVQPIQSNLCNQQEAIYFWRMDAGASGIYLTYPNLPPNQAPESVVALNQNGCVGCHTVSRANGLIAAVNGPIPGKLLMISHDNQPLNVPFISAVYTAFSPDGKRLAYTDIYSDLYVANISDDLTTLEQPAKIASASDATYGALMPTWNTDGKSITFVRALRTDIPNSVGVSAVGASDLYTVDVGTGSLSPLLPTPNVNQLDYYPSYSPDGKWLAFTRSPDTTYGSPNADIWLLNTATGQAFPMALNSSKSDSWPTWSLDSKQLAYNTTQFDDNFDIVIVNIDGVTGNATSLQKLSGASQSGVFEHLPYWGKAISAPTVLDQWRYLLPWLLPLLPLFLLLVICRLPRRVESKIELDPLPPPVLPDPPIQFAKLPDWNGVRVLWEPQPTLVLGLGNAGWQILTHLKKTLGDAALGIPSDKVRLLAIVDSSQNRKPDAGATALDDSEQIIWRDSLANMITNADSDLALREWIDKKYFLEQGAAALDPKVGWRGQRALGRAALIQNLRGNAAETGKSVWDTLLEAARAAMVDNRLTVIIVSDLSDDVASGSFIDHAYLARKLGKELSLSGVRVIGHLISDRALQGAGITEGSEINTAAALRELARIQLATVTVPFKMSYARSEAEPTPFDGTWTQRLFDEIYLHDGERAFAPITRIDPKRGIFPSIADLIALWLDRATREGNLPGFLDRMAGDAAKAQIAEQTLMVNGLGIYQYRLPFADLLEAIRVNYARTLLQVFLVGPNSSDRPDLKDRSKEQLTSRGNTIRDMLLAFLTEELGASESLGENWRRLFRSLKAENITEAARSALAAPGWKASDADTQAWVQWLKQITILILNGRDTTDGVGQDRILTHRAAKIGLAYQFLDGLGDQQRGMLPSLARGPLATVAPTSDHPALGQLMVFAQAAEKLRDELRKIAEGLGVDENAGSVFAELSTRDRHVMDRVSELSQPETRQYILDANKEPLSEVWSKKYTQEPPPGQINPVSIGVGQLSWHYDREGQLKLTLELPKLIGSANQQTVDFDPENTAAFVNGLLDMGSYFVREIRNHENLDELLSQTILQPGKLQTTAASLLQQSTVLLGGADNFRAGHVRQAVILSASKEAKSAKPLADEINNSGILPTGTELLSLETTDPFSLTLAQIVFAIPLEAVDSVRLAFERYDNEVGIRNRNINIPLPAVFEADAIALSLEGKMQIVNRSSEERLSPLVVNALTSRIGVEAFLMMAEAQVEWTVSDKGLEVTAPELNGVLNLLTRNEVESTRYGVLLEGLLNFTEKVGDEQAIRIVRRYSANESLVEALDKWDQAEGRRWQGPPFTPNVNDPRFQTISKIVGDLTAIARLFLKARMGW